ncbi:hypothetical protein SAMN05660649_04318 [Desulfotomaculum arcticum]|uniref:Transcriptional regulator n=1 Tax=Desulfotruncus arcticus DSM 17038 TaxID=1121424 RepID=A0A1I2Y939_9FIRM|nr:hypothetical protein [Desulfotruncus arcticus]SFH22183.1 hypothetical protein SAMN05660649_04318 [Desulfotomaculum arcticum] [Desulfotruncus arcticus DSM 17038]
MFLNKEKVKKLMSIHAEGNYHEFARQLEVDVAQLHRVLNTKSVAGPKFLGRFMKFCKKNGLDYNEYIFLDKPLHVCSGGKRHTGTEGS